ncbi:MAG: hypothetical protein QXL21_03965 [Nitrososphaerales archaeon]
MLYVSKLVRKICLLLLPLLFCISILHLEVDALALEHPLLVKMDREMILSGYGYLLLNDTITFINNSTTATHLPQFTLIYPTQAIDFRINQPLKKEWVRLDRFENASSLTVSADLTISSSSNLTISLRAILGGVVKPTGEGSYEVSLPLPSTPNIVLNDVMVQVSLPSDVKVWRKPEGFEQKQSAKGDVLYREFDDLQPTSNPLTTKLRVNASTYAFTVLTVDRQDRLIKIVSPSEVMVYDSIYIRNEGNGALYSLKISLDKQISSVSLMRGEIPLRDQKTLSVIGGSLDLYSLIRGDLNAGDSISFTVAYPLKALPVDSNNTLLLKIPATPLLKDVLVKEYYLNIEVPRGYFLTGKASFALNYASPLNSEEMDAYIRIGSAWASAQVFPVATLIFIASFLALSAYTAHRKRETEAHPFLELIRLYENSLQLQEEIAETLSTARLERIHSTQIDLFTQQLKEIRAKTASKASQIRSKIPSDPKVEQKLAQFNSLDKMYERTLLDLLSAYKSYLAGKLKREVFEKTVADKTRSLQKLASSLIELLDEISQM